MAMRNFWIEADIDGRQTTFKGGPRSKEGGFDLTIYQRDAGVKVEAVTIRGYANHETGQLRLMIEPGRDNPNKFIASAFVTYRDGSPHRVEDDPDDEQPFWPEDHILKDLGASFYQGVAANQFERAESLEAIN